MDVLSRMKKVQESLEKSKLPFEQYIKNKEIPLDERWEIFILAPSEMKTHENYLTSFDSLPNDFVMYDGPIHADRGNTIETKDMIENIQESLDEISSGDFYRDDYYKNKFLEVDMNAIKEEILSKNMGSFDYDW